MVIIISNVNHLNNNELSALLEDDEDLCARFPGELCAHICVPTGGSSYKCECREGFQLLADGKTCQQSTQYDRYIIKYKNVSCA